MDITRNVRLLAASLITLLGVLHLALAVLGLTNTEFEMLVFASFGLLYILVGVGLFTGRRLFNYLGVVIQLLGLSIGTIFFAANYPVLENIATDVVEVTVILCCLYLIIHKT
ncbi:MAG: hypothetical protein ABSA11_12925 [Candidatus Bathyarchaeia archaeon]|jgi:hypothetical protein